MSGGDGKTRVGLPKPLGRHALHLGLDGLDSKAVILLKRGLSPPDSVPFMSDTRHAIPEN